MHCIQCIIKSWDGLHWLPCILPLIFDIQLRFRFGEKASIVYIQLKFLNIEIDISNRDFLIFLWVKDLSGKQGMVAFRFLTIILGVTRSPFLLEATTNSNVSKYIVARDIQPNLILLLNETCSFTNNFGFE